MRHLQGKSTLRYVSFLKDLVSSYNDEKRVYGYSPREICESDAIAKRVKVERLDSLLKFYKKHDKPPKFHLHQPVRRLLNKKNVFQKGWLPRFSGKILRIRGIVPSVPVKYLLSGYENEPHLYNETYYESQLQPVGEMTAKNYYSQEKRDKEKEREKEDTQEKIEELEEDRILKDRQKEDEREEKEKEKEKEEEKPEREKRETDTDPERQMEVETEARIESEPRRKQEEEEEGKEEKTEEEEEFGSGSAFKVLKTRLIEDKNALARTRSGRLKSMAAQFLIQPLGRPQTEARWISEDSYNRLRQIGVMSEHHGK